MEATATRRLELRDVQGPSAFTGDRRRFFELLWIISKTEFRLDYANTTLGFLWTILKPLAFFGIIFVVLREVFRVGGNIEHFPLILVLGLVLFQYFQESTTRALRSVSSREGVVRKMQFPRFVIPLSVSLTAAVTMLLNLLAVMPLFFAFGVWPTVEWLMLVPIMLVLIAFSTGVGLVLSVLYVRFEDVGQVWSVVSRMLFYASPVLFPIEIVPDSLQEIMSLNPLAPLIGEARHFVIDPSAPTPADVAGIWIGLLVPLAFIVFVTVYGFLLFRREAPRIAEAI